MTLTIRLLGAPEIHGATGPVDAARRVRLTELAAYLVLHPRATSAQMDEALWPERRAEENGPTRCSAVSRLRRWLVDEDGGEHVPRHPIGGFRLEDVRSDVGEWQQLIGPSPKTAPIEQLEAALGLVHGMPLEGVGSRRYGWADSWRLAWRGRIAEASLELTRRHLEIGSWRNAELAASLGLTVEPLSEPLWRMRIHAALRAGDRRAALEAAARVTAVHDRLGIPLEPRTEHLLAGIVSGGWEAADHE